MQPSPATLRTVAKVLSDALLSAERDRPCFEPGDPVWVRVKACERHIRLGLASTVWREGTVMQRLDNGRLHKVSVTTIIPPLMVIVTLSDIRLTPPWQPHRSQRTNP